LLSLALVFSTLALVLSRPVEFVSFSLALSGSVWCTALFWAKWWNDYWELAVPSIAPQYLRAI
jgi:hypothetical protein